MKKTTTALGAAIAATLGASAADAAIVNLTLRTDLSYSGNGSSAGNITSTTSTWDYDTVAQTLTQVGGVFNARFTTAPTTTLFRQTFTGAVLQNAAATATDYSCLEGQFGASMGASICGNYSFGANYANESTATWGPGTATSKTVGGDDVNFGPIQSIANYNYFATVSWDGTILNIGNRSCNPFAPGNASGCATVGGYNTGYLFTLSTPIPAAAWMFGSALGLLGVARRRAKA